MAPAKIIDYIVVHELSHAHHRDHTDLFWNEVDKVMPDYHPAMLMGLLVYGYATGVHSSRKIERACHDSVAFRFIAANTQPDHDSIATFRRRFLPQIEALFVQVRSTRWPKSTQR